MLRRWLPNALTTALALSSTIALVLTMALIPTAASAQSLENGDYSCLIGFRTMLTLGTITISGTNYQFRPQQSGATTKGSFILGSNGVIRWSGDIGTIKNEMIAESGIQPTVPHAFYFTYRLSANNVPETVSCR